MQTNLDKAAYAALLFIPVAIVAHWRVGIIAIILLAILTIARMIARRQWGNPSLSKSQIVCLLTMMLFWLLYVFSALYSTNHAEGWSSVSTKLPFLLLPLLCLISDTSSLTRQRINAVFYTLLAALLIRFAACLVVDAVKYLGGTPFAQLKDWQLDPLGLHHNYLALYITAAFAFIYCECLRHWSQASRRWRISILAATAALLAYLLISASRSGIVITALLGILILVHQTFFRHRWKLSLLTALVIVALTAGAYLVKPDLFIRFTSIFSEMAAGRLGEDRFALIPYGLQTAEGHWLLGHGSGDYMDALMQTYEKNNFAKGLANHYDAHNQYIETLLETGVIGLVIMMLMLLLPAVLALVKTRKADTDHLRISLCILTFVLMASIFFESTLDRQMGVQFVAIAYCLLALSLPPSHTKAN